MRKFKGLVPVNIRISGHGRDERGETGVYAEQDPRHISCGREIPTESYSDQPYIVKTEDGAWLCAVTTGSGHEGASGQHIVTMRSTDMGKTWADTVDVEPSDGPEASYAVLLKAMSERIFCFYNHNTDNIRKIKVDPVRRTDGVGLEFAYADGYCRRVDSVGYFVFKYSDDNGRCWSKKRYRIDVRAMEIDRENVYGGAIRFFWNVGKPFIHEGSVFVPLCKVGGFGPGFFTRNEGVLLKCDNIFKEKDPERIRWETLPDGDIGLRPPEGGGPIAGEHSYCVLSDGSFFCVYRTVDGYPVVAMSRDGGHTWSPPAYHRYADGYLIKNPRAANFVWKCENGRYLYWFHNNGGRFIPERMMKDDSYPYENRNPVWCCGGIEADTPEGKIIRWSQPEILIYDDDPLIRMSYPDLVEENGRYFVTETQKNKARVHEIDPEFLDTLWKQLDCHKCTTENVILDISDGEGDIPGEVIMPRLPVFIKRDLNKSDYGKRDLHRSFALELSIRMNSLRPGQIVLDSRDDGGRGIALRTSPERTLEIVLCDGQTMNVWDTDPGALEEGRLHHIVINVDGGPKIISFIVDGRLLDGGDYRQFGWGRFSPNLADVNGSGSLRIAPELDGELKSLRIYGCYLLTSEAVGNYRASCI